MSHFIEQFKPLVVSRRPIVEIGLRLGRLNRREHLHGVVVVVEMWQYTLVVWFNLIKVNIKVRQQSLDRQVANLLPVAAVWSQKRRALSTPGAVFATE